MDTYITYRLKLPSGGVLRVRKPHPLLLLGQGARAMPLLGAAIDASRKEDTATDYSPQSAYERVMAVVALAIVDAVDPHDLTWVDAMAVYSWATAPGTDGAVRDAERAWNTADLLPLVKSSAAVLLDAVCRRYGLRPSVMMGLRDLMLANDLDLAVGYRGIRHEGAGAGDEEMEVEDAWGNIVKVPASCLPQQPQGARLMNVEWYGQKYGQYTLSAGGQHGDGLIGAQDRFRQH